MTHFDAIVLGGGGIGSAAAMHLAAAGMRTLVLDRFPPGHDRGSSHGQTRIIRQAYFEHPDYVPLTLRAYHWWEKLAAEEESSRDLFLPTGLLQAGDPHGAVLRGVIEAATQHHLPIEKFSATEAARRFPMFRFEPNWEAVFEPRAGVLRVERCVQAQAAKAACLGATFRSGVEVLGWSADESEVVVRARGEEFRAGRLAIAAGAWSGELLGPLWSEYGIRLRVLRKHLHWHGASEGYHERNGCPAYLFECGTNESGGENGNGSPVGTFYGFPAIDDQGIKIAEHSRGTETTDPLHDDRTPEGEDSVRVAQFRAALLPGSREERLRHAVCFYTMSPDEHFLIDRHPRHERVVFAAGLSGHGFKFAPVLGEAMCDLLLHGRTDLPIGFLGLQRFGK